MGGYTVLRKKANNGTVVRIARGLDRVECPYKTGDQCHMPKDGWCASHYTSGGVSKCGNDKMREAQLPDDNARQHG